MSPRLLADLDFGNRDRGFRGREGRKGSLCMAAEEDGVIGTSDVESTFQLTLLHAIYILSIEEKHYKREI